MDKSQLRDSLKALPPINPAVSLAVSSHLFGWLSGQLPGTVATYRAMTGEVDVNSLVSRLPGWRWILPRIEDDARLTWRDARVPLERHRWGMEQPTDSGQIVPIHEIDFFLVPGLAFDQAGNRLGRGRGFYDRELAVRRPDAKVVGVTTQARILGEVPTEPHDQPVWFLATETGVTGATPKISPRPPG